jgi:8-oxo-dGTP diphosphatase
MLRSTRLKRLEVAVLVLINHQNRVLLTQRRNNVHLAGYWEFPGGKIEAGETPHQTLVREIQEELAYHPKKAKIWQTIDYTYPDFSVRLHIFKEYADHPDVTANEQQAMQWCAIKDLKKQQLPPANQDIVAALTKAHASQ